MSDDVKTVEVKITDHSHSARRSLHYLNYGTYDEDDSVHFNQAHANDNGVTKRNYLVDGINCRSSYHEALHDFNTYYRKKPNNSVQTLNMILSFGRELDWSKPEDRYEGDIFARKFVARAFPNHQAVLGEQMDNTRKMSHIHLYVNALSMKPPYNTIPGGRSVHYYRMHPNAKRQPVNYGINHLRRVAQGVINDINEHEQGFTHHFDRVTKLGDHSKYTVNSGLNHVQNYVLSHVEQVMNETNVTRPQELRNELRQFGIHTSFKRSGSRRRHRRGRKRRRRRYLHGGIVFRVDTKNGHVVPYQHGLKKAKGVTRHYVKSSVLGRVSDFGYRGIQHQFKLNKERPKSIIMNDSGMDSMVSEQDAERHEARENSIEDEHEDGVDFTTSLDDALERSHSEYVSASTVKSASVASSRDVEPTMQKSVNSVSEASSAPATDSSKFTSYSNATSMALKNAIRSYQAKSSAELAHIKAVSRVNPKTLSLSRISLEPSVNVHDDVNNAMNGLSTVTIQQSMPTMSKVYQTEAYDKPNGLKEFHIVSNGLGYTDKDKSVTESLFGKLRDGLATVKDKFKQTRIYKTWQKVDSEIHGYLKLRHRDRTPDPHKPEDILNNYHLSFKVLSKQFFLPDYEKHVPVPHLVHRRRAELKNAKIDRDNRHIKAERKRITSMVRIAPAMDKRLNSNHQQFISLYGTPAGSVASAVSSAKADVQHSEDYRSSQVQSVKSNADVFATSASSSASSAITKFVATSTSIGSYAGSVARLSGHDRISGMNKIGFGPGLQGVAFGYAEDVGNSLYDSRSVSSSASASQSASVASSASISASQSSRASSAMHLPYFDWKFSLSEARELENSDEASVLTSAGSNRSRKYTGSCGIVTRGYENSTVDFNTCYSLERTDSVYSSSVSHSASMSKVASLNSGIDHTIE